MYYVKQTPISHLPKLPHNLYMQISYKIKDYERVCQVRRELLQGIGGVRPVDGLPRANNVGRPVENLALRLTAVESEICAVRESAAEMKKAYSKATFEGFDPIEAFLDFDYFRYMFRVKDEESDGPCKKTWNNYKRAFCTRVAEKLGLL